MKKLILVAIVAVALSTAAYALISADCRTCPTPCGMQSVTPMCGADAPKCDPNSKPAPKCGGDAPKCDPNSKPAPKSSGDAPKCDPNSKPKCGGK
jgi:hypothetical protein